MAKKKKKDELEQILKGTYNPNILYYSPKSKSLDDIAPVRANKTNLGGPVTAGKSNTRTELTNSKTNDKWFTSGAYGDDKGNIVTDTIDTILGTGADIGLGVAKGIFSIGEGIGDLFTYGEAQIFDWLGKDEFADSLRTEASRSLAEDWFNPIENTIAKSSILGDKGDAISEGLGYVAGTVATGGLAGGLGKTASSAGKLATTATTGQTFLSSMGSSMGEAYRGGATDGEAWAYGTVGGIAEAGTELIFGGLGKAVGATGLSKGLSSADDQLAKKLTSKIKSTIAKNFVEYGIKAGAEGLEEVGSGIIQAIGQKLTYASEEEIGQLIKDQNLLDQFITGAVVSGIAQAPGKQGFINATKEGRDFVSNYTENEQKVIDAEVSERLQALQENNKKASNKDIARITQEVEEDFEKGYISTESIEKTLGKDIDLSKDYRLQESYNEKVRKGTGFTYKQSSSMSEHEIDTYESAVNKVNDTRHAHEVVDGIAQMSKDRGVSYKITNNKELAEMKKTKKGKVVNGLYEVDNNGKKEIYVNLDSSKYLEQILVHETFHDIKKSNDVELSKDIEDATIEYAKATGDYQKIYDEVTKNYNNVYKGKDKQAKINEEVTARLLEDYIGTDTFIENLTTKKPGVIKKFIEEIKYLIKKFNASTPEKRKLLELQHKMEKAYKKAYNSKTNSVEGTKETRWNTDAKNVVENEKEVVKQEINKKTDEKIESDNKPKQDNEGRSLTIEQQDFFKDSKVRDENGNLLKMYHGTGTDFNVFDMDKAGENYEDSWSAYGKGFYFTVDKDSATEYAEYAIGDNPNVKEVYLDVKNPFYANESYPELFKKYNLQAHNPTGRNFISQINVEQGRDASTKILKELGYDGVIEDFGDKIDEIVVFNSNQIKNVDNTNPTDSEDTRYSLSDIPLEERVSGDDLLDAQDLIEDIKSVNGEVDENGYVTVYHQTTTENANKILETGKMTAKEFGVFFSTSKDAQQSDGRGTTKLEFKIPAEKLLIDDIFDDNIDVKIPLKRPGEFIDVSDYLVTSNDDIRYSLSDEGLKEIADEFGGGKNYWEANLYDKDLYGATYFLKHQDSVKKKFKELNNINIEPVYKDIELKGIGTKDENVQNFIKDNNLNVVDLANNQELLDKFYELEHEAIKKQFNVDDTKADEIFSQWKDYFEKQKGANETIWPLLRFEKDFKNIIEGNTREIDNIETAKLERQLVDDNPEFEKYVTKYAEKLFGEKVEYDVDDVMEEAKSNHGTTDNFEVGAYMTTDGSLLNFNYGGYRDDHRTISVYDLNMKEFMDYGAIRMQPETPGFEMQVEPTNEQYNKLYDYIDYIKSTRKSDDVISIDIDKGNTYDSATYTMNTPTSKIISDVRTYWKTGQFPKQSEFAQFRYSLSREDDIAPVKGTGTLGSDIKIQVEEAIAPLKEEITALRNEISNTTTQGTETNLPVEADSNTQEMPKALTLEDLPMLEAQNNISNTGDVAPVRNNLTEAETQELDYLEAIENSLDNEQRERLQELRDIESSVYEENEISPTKSLFETRDYAEVGSQKVKAYQYENPEVKPYFREEALSMLHDLNNSTKGEKMVLGDISQLGGGYYEFTGTKRHTTLEIEQLLDGVDGKLKLSYDEIRKGLNALIEDNGLENNKASKRIEFFIDQRLREGYEDIEGNYYPPNQEYINMLKEKGVTEYSQEAYDNWLATLDDEAIKNMIPIEENASNTEETVKNVPKNDLGYIPQDPTKESTYEDSIKKDPVMDFLEQQVKKNNLDNVVKPKEAQVNKSKVRNAIDTFRTLFVNRFDVVDRLAKKTGNKMLTYKADMVNGSYAEAETDINKGQTNNKGQIIGKSVKQLFQPSKDAGLYEAFNDYLFNKSNIERHAQGKGSTVPDSVSRTLIKAYESSNPEFKEWAKDIYKYYDNVLKNEVEAGLVTKETAKFLRGDKMYPSYVPFYETDVDSRYFDDKGNIKTPNVIKRAKGGAKNLLSIEEAMNKQTHAYKSAIRTNLLYQEIVHTLGNNAYAGADFTRADTTDMKGNIQTDADGNHILTAYENGIEIGTMIDEEMYKSLSNEVGKTIKEYEDKFSIIVKPLQKLSEIRRNLLTTWNPFFIITNPIKDIQDAVFNSKYSKDMIKNYPGAYLELARQNTPEVRQFTSLYGSGGNFGEQSVMTNKPGNKFLQKLSAVNDIVELAPRYAEFKASLQNGTTVEEALYNAKDITTNFGRGGEITKALNRDGFTFLNTSVQGFDKLYRNFSGENGAKGYIQVLSKAVIYGIAPALLNALLFDDDEEYEALPDYIKDNYYIFKTGEGEFIRIPKGRVISVFGSAGRRTLEFLQGEENAYEGYLKNAYSQVGVSNPLESNIFAPLLQAYGSEEGKTWYGEDLVPTRLQDKPKEEQYDEGTDEFSKWLGEKLNVSPYKLNYVLDQYSGGIGDLILPTITEEAKNEGGLLAPFADKFTANSTFDNKYAGDFYSTKEKIDITANGSNASDEDKLKSKYLYSVSSDMAQLYKEKREIQSDTSLSKSEKYEKVQSIQQEINRLAQEGLETYENISKTSDYAIVGDKEYYKYFDEENEEYKWSSVKEEELDELNSLGLDLQEKSTYFNMKNATSEIASTYSDYIRNASDEEKDELYANKKLEIANAVINSNLSDSAKYYLYSKHYSSDTGNIMESIGVSADAYINFDMQTFTADKTRSGKTISGSKKKKVFNYINSMDLSFEQKAILAKMEYNSYDEWNYEIVDYLNNLKTITYEDEVEILEKLGFNVSDDGTVRW